MRARCELRGVAGRQAGLLRFPQSRYIIKRKLWGCEKAKNTNVDKNTTCWWKRGGRKHFLLHKVLYSPTQRNVWSPKWIRHSTKPKWESAKSISEVLLHVCVLLQELQIVNSACWAELSPLLRVISFFLSSDWLQERWTCSDLIGVWRSRPGSHRWPERCDRTKDRIFKQQHVYNYINVWQG